MKKFILNIVLAVLCLNFTANAQDKPNNITALKIGDKVPDIPINNIINYEDKDGKSATTAKISDFKGKLLILDFWSTWCSSCLYEMPFIAQLNQRFVGQIQIVSVTSQKTKTINAFLQRNKQVSNLKITMALGDTGLSALFPNKMLPHIVWINPQGVYLGATTQTDLNDKNIHAVLTGNQPHFTEYKNDNLHFDSGKPLFVDGNGNIPAYEYKSFITLYQPGIPNSIGTIKDANGVRIHATNVDLPTLIVRALGEPLYKYTKNRFLIEPSIFSSIIFRDTNEPINKELFCYELSVRNGTVKEANDQMLDELQRFFHFKASVQKRSVKCWVLCVGKKHNKLITTDTVASDNLYDRSTHTKQIKGQPLITFVEYLNHQKGLPIVLDESGVKDNVNLRFNPDSLNFETLNNSLKSLGLVLKEELRDIDMIIVSKEN